MRFNRTGRGIELVQFPMVFPPAFGQLPPEPHLDRGGNIHTGLAPCHVLSSSQGNLGGQHADSAFQHSVYSGSPRNDADASPTPLGSPGFARVYHSFLETEVYLSCVGCTKSAVVHRRGSQALQIFLRYKLSRAQ